MPIIQLSLCSTWIVFPVSRPEPIMLYSLPIILSRISQKFLLFFFILVSSLLSHNNAHLVSVTSCLVFKMLLQIVLPELIAKNETFF